MKKIFFIVIALAFVLRIYALGTNRPGLTNDEAAIGYNAYSILKTARDEHGEFMPIVFKSFGDWKPGLYIYATVPSIAIFGLNEFAIRFPNALAGLIGIITLYFLVNKLFKDENIALLSAFFLSISPWHINFSRGAWEANLALTLLLLAIYFFISNTKKYNIIFSAIFFALSLWAYQSAKFASVVMLISLIIFYKDRFIKLNKKYLFTAFFIGLILSLPIAFSILNGKGGRIEVMSVFSYTRSEKYINDTILSQENIIEDSMIFNIFHSENFNLLRGVMGRYFNNFSGRFLFFEGDWSNAKHTSPNFGYFLFFDLVFILIGLITIAKNIDKKEYQFLLFWLFVAPLSAALTRDSVHGVRSLNLVIPLAITIGLGASKFVRSYRKIFVLIFSLIYIYNFAIYVDAYYIHGPVRDSEQYSYGHRLVVEKVLDLQKNHDQIIFTQGYDQPYIYFLFYGKYDPQNYQLQDNFEKSQYGDVGLITKLDNIEFRNINWPADKLRKGSVIVGRFTDIPVYEIENNSDYNYEVIKYLNGEPAFYVVEVL